ncbi:MAG: DUF1906 domain-containing protein [Pyrinomonadaceae bacterium]|nr:DUF1906 domain-containing protein [Acidobacteriota bacterium]MBK7933227.1 DUF1906 domain-containing protein [Acidobacteriota bacterium]MBP7375145.1 DUF1906 domain-containing protein [Pyrinomonadaceae bacterium]
MRNSSIAILFLTLSIATAVFSQVSLTYDTGMGRMLKFGNQEPGLPVRSDEAEIVGIQSIGGASGVALTRRALYSTNDGGINWSELNLEPKGNMVIAHAVFVDRKKGGAVMVSRQENTVDLSLTSDGGVSWTTFPVAIRRDLLLGANIEDAVLGMSDELRLTIPLETSSNFAGSLIFVSVDGGMSWDLRSKTVDMSPDMPAAAEIISGNWKVRTDGICFGFKTGCFQESRLLINEIDVTPPQIKLLATINRARAKAEAERRPMFALPRAGSTRTSLNRGFDMCNAPTAAQMMTWWNNSPHYDMNIYISGRNRACSAQPNLSAAWVNQVSAMGWGLIPTVVGYQSPCTASATSVKLSYDVATAETQGRGEADIAVADANNLGITAGSILYYDMERYDPPTPDTLGCRPATVAFLKGWTDRIKELGYKSGVYGSPKNAQEDWVGLPPASKMDAIWMARWDNIMSVWTYLTFPNFPTGEWANHQRIKQWQAPHNETWGGVTFNIDGNISDGPVAGNVVARNKNADFDGDGKSDLSIYRPDSGAWYFLFSASGSASGILFGAAGDIPVPGDYDGDGKTDAAIFRPADGSWHMLTKAGVYRSMQFGTNGDIPAAADFNGDGKTDQAVFRPSNSTWYIANSDSRGTFTYVQFGQAGDKPAPADYDGDGKADIAIFRPAGTTGTEWWVSKSSGGLFATQFGTLTDKAVPVDFTGDGKADVTFWRPATGEWFVLRSEDLSYYAFPFGTNGDLPASGDFDGDGLADAAVFRPSNAVWYMLRSQAGFLAVQFGLSDDRPIQSFYLPQ